MHNKSTQTDGSFTDYLKQQTTEKTQGTQKNETHLLIQEKVTPLIQG